MPALRQIKRRHDAVTAHVASENARHARLYGGFDRLVAEIRNGDYDDEGVCACCGGIGGDPMCDYVLPCPECGEG